MTAPTMWERVGNDGVAALLQNLFDRIELDPVLMPKFAGIDVDTRIKPHLAKLIIWVLGGLQQYDTERLREAHARLKITDPEFDRLVVHFAGAMIAVGWPGDIVMHVGVTAQSTRPLIVTPPEVPPGVRLFVLDESAQDPGKAVRVLSENAPRHVAFDVCVGLRHQLLPGRSAWYQDPAVAGGEGESDTVVPVSRYTAQKALDALRGAPEMFPGEYGRTAAELRDALT